MADELIEEPEKTDEENSETAPPPEEDIFAPDSDGEEDDFVRESAEEEVMEDIPAEEDAGDEFIPEEDMLSPETEDSEDLFASEETAEEFSDEFTEEDSGDVYTEESDGSDEYTEETEQGWFSRLGGAVKGVIIGGIIFLIGFPVIFLNEGRAVKRYKTLNEGAGSVISIQPAADAKNEGKLVHVSGLATTDEILTDGEKSSGPPPIPVLPDKADPQNEGKPVYVSGAVTAAAKIPDKDFGFAVSAIRLERRVRMYQWQEVTGSSDTDKKLGGKEVTKTSYAYKKVWSDKLIPSGSFRQKAGHENPGAMKYSAENLTAENVTLGAFTLHRDFIEEMNDDKALNFAKLPELPAELKGKVQLYKGRLFIGKAPDKPEIGDMIVEYSYIRPQDISLIARQEKTMLVPYITPDEKNLSRLVMGKRKLEEMMPPAGISVNAIRLKRTVQMYQWKEEKKTENKGGDSKKTLTKYSYSKVWSENMINSDSFKEKGGHSNPKKLPVEGSMITAQKVTMGSFELPARFIQQMGSYEPLPAASVIGALPESLRANAKTLQNAVFIGKDSANPQIGDIQISYGVVKPQQVSLISQQQGKSFVPFKSRYEGTIDEFRMGTVSADEIFKQEKNQNKTMTWVLRIAGFLLMFIGLAMVFKPLSVVLDVIPFLGNLAEKGFAIVSFLIASGFALVTIAIAWFFYRPLLSCILIAISAGAFFGIKFLREKKGAGAAPPRAARPPAAPQMSPPPPPPGS